MFLYTLLFIIYIFSIFLFSLFPFFLLFLFWTSIHTAAGVIISQSAILRVDHQYRWANSSEDSITIAGPTKPKQGIFLEHPAQEVKKTVPLGPTGHLLHKATPMKTGSHRRSIQYIETSTKRQQKWGYKEIGPK